MSEGLPETDKDIAWLHGTMATATAHLEAVRMDPARLRRAQRRRRLSESGMAAGVLSVALAATAVAMYAGGGAGKTETQTQTPALSGSPRTSQAPTAPGQLIVPTAVSVYDEDDSSEGKATVDKLLTGTGAWETFQYCQSHATVGGAPKGTGVVFDLGAPTHLTTVTVGIGTPGADMEVWAGDSTVKWPVPEIRNQPPDGFTKAAAVPASAAGTTNVFRLAGFETRYVLVWFSGTLPTVPNPDPAIHCHQEDGKRYGDSITSVKFARG